MKWMLGLVVGLSCIGGVIYAGDSTSLANSVYNQKTLLNKLAQGCLEGNVELVKNMIKYVKKENLNSRFLDGVTLLMFSALKGHKKIVKVLLQYDADANLQSDDGGTALIAAVQNNHQQVVRLLLGSRIDKNASQEDGSTAIMIAAQNGYEKIVEMLLKYGVNANAQAKDGATALMLAAKNRYEKVVEMLLQYGVDANKFLSTNGATALMLAAQNGYEKIVEVLLRHGVDANVQAQDGDTALILAAQNGYEKIAEMLLQHGVDANVQAKSGDTALILAAQNGCEKVAEMLLKYGVDANVQREDGATGLMIAAQNGYEKIVKLLLQYGVSCDYLNAYGATALMLAVVKGNKEIAELLICHNADTELKLKEKNRTASDVLDNLSDYGISLEDEKIHYLKYILNSARVLDKSGLNSALTEYPQVKEMLVKRVLTGINKVYKEDVAIRDINDQQAQSNALPISNLFCIEKAKLSFIQDNYGSILDAVYEDEYCKQQAIEAGHFAEYQSKKYVFRNLSKAIKNQRFSDLVVYTQDNF